LDGAYRPLTGLGRPYIFPPEYAQKTGELHRFQLRKRQAGCRTGSFRSPSGD
jgi:hypothetical protein